MTTIFIVISKQSMAEMTLQVILIIISTGGNVYQSTISQQQSDRNQALNICFLKHNASSGENVKNGQFSSDFISLFVAWWAVTQIILNTYNSVSVSAVWTYIHSVLVLLNGRAYKAPWLSEQIKITLLSVFICIVGLFNFMQKISFAIL